MKRILTTALTLVAITWSTAFAQSAVLSHKGAELDGQLQTPLSSKTSHDGDTFTLKEKDTFFHKNPELKGAIIEGHVEGVTAAGPTHKATMNLIFDDIVMADGSKAPIHVTVKSIKEFEPKTHHVRDAGLIIGGMVAGHIVSKKTGHKGGTLGGAAAGFALASGMKSDINVHKGTLVRLRVNDDITAAGAM
jgi:hypothetical protein